MAASCAWEVAGKLERDRLTGERFRCFRAWLLAWEIRDRGAKMTPGFLDWTVEADSYQFGKLKEELAFRRRTMSSVFVYWGWQCLTRKVRLLTGPGRRSFSVKRVILLPGTNEDLHWESEKFGLEYAKEKTLKLKFRCIIPRFSFRMQTLSF